MTFDTVEPTFFTRFPRSSKGFVISLLTLIAIFFVEFYFIHHVSTLNPEISAKYRGYPVTNLSLWERVLQQNYTNKLLSKTPLSYSLSEFHKYLSHVTSQDEVNKDQYCDEKLCLNGLCSDDLTQCICEKGFTGKWCEFRCDNVGCCEMNEIIEECIGEWVSQGCGNSFPQTTKNSVPCSLNNACLIQAYSQGRCQQNNSTSSSLLNNAYELQRDLLVNKTNQFSLAYLDQTEVSSAKSVVESLMITQIKMIELLQSSNLPSPLIEAITEMSIHSLSQTINLTHTLSRAVAERDVQIGIRELSMINDVAHDLFHDLCADIKVSPAQRGCPSYPSLGGGGFHLSVGFYVIFFVVLGGIEVMVNLNPVIVSHFAWTVVITRFMRVTLFATTTLGPIDYSCRLHYSLQPGDHGGCGDLLFSGHSIIIMCVICLSWQFKWVPKIASLILTLFGFHTMFSSAFERFHYSADVILAIYITPLVFIVIGNIFQVNLPDPVREKIIQKRKSITGQKLWITYLLFFGILGGILNEDTVGSLLGFSFAFIFFLIVHFISHKMGYDSTNYFVQGSILDFNRNKTHRP
eukprot:c17521_g1_i1.p1 GENE.c17521_g1_i1~~c17521_g1_i1.p1  ORF type:complete len:587 (-),score=203.30 c17521_g1_i1:46-1773(-)